MITTRCLPLSLSPPRSFLCQSLSPCSLFVNRPLSPSTSIPQSVFVSLSQSQFSPCHHRHSSTHISVSLPFPLALSQTRSLTLFCWGFPPPQTAKTRTRSGRSARPAVPRDPTPSKQTFRGDHGNQPTTGHRGESRPTNPVTASGRRRCRAPSPANLLRRTRRQRLRVPKHTNTNGQVPLSPRGDRRASVLPRLLAEGLRKTHIHK